jgi:hypothetical protein
MTGSRNHIQDWLMKTKRRLKLSRARPVVMWRWQPACKQLVVTKELT